MYYYFWIPEEDLASEFPAEYLKWKLMREKYHQVSHKNLVDYLEFEALPKNLHSIKGFPDIQKELTEINNDLWTAYQNLKLVFQEKYNIEMRLMNDEQNQVVIRYFPKNRSFNSFSEFQALEKELNRRYDKEYLWIAGFNAGKIADKLDFIIIDTDY